MRHGLLGMDFGRVQKGDGLPGRIIQYQRQFSATQNQTIYTMLCSQIIHDGQQVLAGFRQEYAIH